MRRRDGWKSCGRVCRDAACRVSTEVQGLQRNTRGAAGCGKSSGSSTANCAILRLNAEIFPESEWKRLREQLEEREEENETMRRELVQMRKDREDIRTRVEKMLGQMESLTQEQAAS